MILKVKGVRGIWVLCNTPVVTFEGRRGLTAASYHVCLCLCYDLDPSKSHTVHNFKSSFNFHPTSFFCVSCGHMERFYQVRHTHSIKSVLFWCPPFNSDTMDSLFFFYNSVGSLANQIRCDISLEKHPNQMLNNTPVKHGNWSALCICLQLIHYLLSWAASHSLSSGQKHYVGNRLAFRIHGLQWPF